MFRVLYTVLLIISSILVQADSNATTISFLLMTSSSDYSTLVDQTLEEIKMEFEFELKYKASYNKASLMSSMIVII